MPSILVTIETLTPLLATSFQGDPNSDVSYDYIPGSMLRGALIGRYLRHHKQRELNLENDQVKRLFFSDQHTRYLNGYLASQQHRSLPIPRSWYKEKGTELSKSSPLDIYDFTVEYNKQLESPKKASDQFWIKANDCFYLHKPSRRVNIHNQRDRTKGRSSKKEGNPKSEGEIFRYDALAADQTFQSVILCEEQELEILEQLLNNRNDQNIWLGGSRSAGYGHAKLSHQIDNRWWEVKEEWQEIDESLEERAEEEGLTITLLSDALLRDQWGQPTADPKLLQKAINDLLGNDILLPAADTFSSSTLIGGFNRKWGLPLPQLPALAAGTVVVFKDVQLSTDQIRHLEWHGIGDRLNEGFGRIVVNCHQQSSFSIRVPEKDSSGDSPAITYESSRKLALVMAERLLRQRLDRQLKRTLEVTKLKRNAEGKFPISNSQLSRLSTAVRTGLSSDPISFQPVSDLLDNLAKISRDQFETTYMDRDNTSLYEQLRKWIKQPSHWMGDLSNLNISIGSNVTRQINVNHPQDPLAIEYTLRLIAAVAKQAYKENSQ
ncbi:MAG: RAMP superfamily CRISPR-associated protein [Cyanobacteria bacterium P01_H01_bin.21]